MDHLSSSDGNREEKKMAKLGLDKNFVFCFQSGLCLAEISISLSGRTTRALIYRSMQTSNLCELTIRTRKPSSKLNNEKYVDRRSNSVITRQTIMNEL